MPNVTMVNKILTIQILKYSEPFPRQTKPSCKGLSETEALVALASGSEGRFIISSLKELKLNNIHIHY